MGTQPGAAAVRADAPARMRLAGAALPLIAPARMYVCGITPYDVTHLGHAATFVWADAAAATMRLAGADVVTTRNVTDVDDVLTRAARERGRAYDEFGLHQEFWFERDMTALRVRRPTHAPHARHYVSQVIQLAAALLSVDAAYVRDGQVLLRGAGVPASVGLDRDEALVLAREYGDQPDDPRRDDPFDVPVWQPSGEQDPGWPSPWGHGRPGWHAECAAMALATLGGTVDVLAGGADLAFPHHAYQVALAQAALGATPFARRQMRVGAVYHDGAKMAKSTGNLVLVSDLLDRASPASVRLLLLDRAWQADWEYRADDLDAAGERLTRLYAAAGAPARSENADDAVVAALLDDLDVPTALGVAEEARGHTARLLLRALALE